MENLITVPTFIFKQGDIYDGGEQPIQVCYYRTDIVELSQDSGSIIIRKQDLNRLLNTIKKHYPEAEAFLSKV